jgi:hypothetical protein
MTQVQTERAPTVRDDAPVLAHRADRGQRGPIVALCGKRLIGVPAPYDAPICVVCEDLHERWLRGLS